MTDANAPLIQAAGLRARGGAVHLRRAGVGLIVLAIAVSLLVPLALGGREALAATLRLSAAGYIGLFALIAGSWVARAIKLQVLMRRLALRPGFARTLALSLASDFAFVVTPAGVGGYVASIHYLRNAGASGSAATTITVVDQGLDLLFFGLAVPLAGLLLLAAGQSPRFTAFAFGAAALGATLVGAAWFMRRSLAGWISSPHAWLSRWPRLREKQRRLHTFVGKIGAQFELLRAGGALFLLVTIALTALQWLTRYGVLWLALRLLGYDIAFALVFLLQVLVLHAALWTGVPAGGGGAEIGLSAMLAIWVPPAGIATALLLWRGFTLYTSLAVGTIAIALLARSKKVRVQTRATTASGELERPPLHS